MEMMGGFSFVPLAADKEGVFASADKDELQQLIADGDLTDILVLSHGWNNEETSARGLYRRLLTSMKTRMDEDPADWSGRRFGVAGVFWPSVAFPANWFAQSEGRSGHAASIEQTDQDLRDSLSKTLDTLRYLLDADHTKIAELKALLPDIGIKASARKKFLRTLQSLLPEPSDPDSDNSGEFKTSGDDLIAEMQAPLPPTFQNLQPPTIAEGGAAGIGSFASGFMAGTSRLLNYATYFVMKERAGKVGAGLNSVLAGVRSQFPELRIHLAGHSFGARVVTAAAGGLTPFAPSTMSLLQGAFSHNAFAPANPVGFYRNVVAQRRVRGPIMVTHTRNDRAVGILYALASRVSGVNASAFGNANDEFGGIGSNGARMMAQGEASDGMLLGTGEAYGRLLAGLPNNLRADQFISDHSDVAGEEVANALLAAIRAAA